jgi:hypothetical protein
MMVLRCQNQQFHRGRVQKLSHGFADFGTIVISIERVAKSKIGKARSWVRRLAISPPIFFDFWEIAFPLEFSEKKNWRELLGWIP